MNKLQILQQMYDKSSNIVFFGGAGVSTESGIPDFRSKDGLYNQKWKFPPETIISRSFFDANPKEFYKFYREKLLVKNIKPNKAHEVLAQMEEAGKLSAVITQNIDGLHQLAGSKNVLELHGSVLRNFCTKCKEFYDADFIEQSKNNAEELPICKKCSSLVKPDVVLYEESLNALCLQKAIEEISKANMLIIGGTSLTVFPAAGLIRYFSGKYLVIINKDTTPTDESANLVIHESIGSVLGSLRI